MPRGACMLRYQTIDTEPAAPSSSQILLIVAGRGTVGDLHQRVPCSTGPSTPTHHDAPADGGAIIGLAARRQYARCRHLSLPAAIETETSPIAVCFDPGRPCAGSGCLACTARFKRALDTAHYAPKAAASSRAAPATISRRQQHFNSLLHIAEAGQSAAAASIDASPVVSSTTTACAARSCAHAWWWKSIAGPDHL